jgi:diguanylate cyclase (GGDEF)-like protein/PAS domain S-box-containing protein
LHRLDLLRRRSVVMKNNKPKEPANYPPLVVGTGKVPPAQALPPATSTEVAEGRKASGLVASNSNTDRTQEARADGKQGTRPHAWNTYLVLGTLSAFGFFLLSGGEHGILYDLFYDLVGTSAVAAILAGVWINRPKHPLPWYLFASGQLMFVAGDLTLNVYENLLHIEAPFPSVSDLFWLSAYPILTAGLVLLIRSRAPGRDWDSLIDAAIVATGMGVLSWVFLINPYVDDLTLSLLERFISMGYPLMDILLLAVAARLAVAPGAHTPAYRLFGLSLICLLIADTIYAKMLIDGTYYTGSLPDLGFLLSYVFWGAAALHPTMRTLSELAPDRRMQVSRTRLALLAGASLTAPLVLGVQAMRGATVGVPVIVGGSVVLFLFVFARMVGLLRNYERAIDRERILSKAGSALVAASNRESIYEATVGAALELAGNTSQTRASIVIGSAEMMVVATAAGDRAAEAHGAQLKPRELPDSVRSGILEEQIAVAERVDPAELREALGFEPKAGAVLASPLLVQEEFSIALLIDSDSTLAEALVDGLEALGSQVVLSLESVALAEDLHQRQSEARFRSLIQNASDLILILSSDGDLRYVSPSIQRILGRTPEEVIDTTVSDWVHPDDKFRMLDALSRCLEASELTPMTELRLAHSDGSWRYVELIGNNLLDEPTVSGLVFNARDITERKRAKAKLQEAEAKYRSLVEQIPTVIYMDDVDETNSALYRSPFIREMLGYTPEELVSGSVSWQDLLHAEDRELVLAENARTNKSGKPFKIEYRLIHRDGRVVWVRDEAMLIRDDAGEPLYWQGVFIDITERKELEAQLVHQAFHDPLTGLPNRVLFMDRLGQGLARTARHGHRIAILFLDLDNFKVINDSLGHKAGDQLLVAVADRLLACVRPGDTVARFGGDEFTLLLEYVSDSQEPARVAERVSEELHVTFNIEGHEVVVTTSIGISLGASGYDEPEDLLRNADVAMYEAKNKGRARHELFNSDMDARARERLQLEGETRHAVSEGEFRVYYQPVVKLDTGKIIEVEALVRWEHPRHGLLSPDNFIPLAEETGLIVPIGQRVLEDACRQVRSWQKHTGVRGLVLSVNLSPKQLQYPELVEDVSQILSRTELDPRYLKLEITERLMMDDAESSIVILRKLRDMGVQIAIDDFGTGYSSLSYLKRFPVNVLKIDRSFVEGLGRVSEDTAIVRATIAFARSLGMSVTAEGIETAEQLTYVRALGCDLGQGYYLSRPLPSDAAGELLCGGGIPSAGQEEWAISDVTRR